MKLAVMHASATGKAARVRTLTRFRREKAAISMPPPQPPSACLRAYSRGLAPLSHLTQSRSGVSAISSFGWASTQSASSRRSRDAEVPSPRPYASEWYRQLPSPGCRTCAAEGNAAG